MLSKLRFTQGASGELVVHSDCLREYETITQENKSYQYTERLSEFWLYICIWCNVWTELEEEIKLELEKDIKYIFEKMNVNGDGQLPFDEMVNGFDGQDFKDFYSKWIRNGDSDSDSD